MNTQTVNTRQQEVINAILNEMSKEELIAMLQQSTTTTQPIENELEETSSRHILTDYEKSQIRKKKHHSAKDPIVGEDIARAKVWFHEKEYRYSANRLRNYALFVTGCNIGRRAIDIVSLKVEDVIDMNGNIVDSIIIYERKTKKYTEVYLNDSVKEALKEYLDSVELEEDDYLFPSREKDENGKKKPLSVRSVSNVLKQMAKEIGIDEKYDIASHSMRKTFARNIYENFEDKTEGLVMVQEMLNQSSTRVAMRYIGINKEVKRQTYMNNMI